MFDNNQTERYLRMAKLKKNLFFLPELPSLIRSRKHSAGRLLSGHSN
jgi:hypothetical protein